MKIVTAQEMRHIEDECVGLGLTSAKLMENAGQAVAQHILKLSGSLAGKKVVVLAGPGNNGGDGLVAARCLRDMGATVCVYLGAPRTDDANLIQVLARDIEVVDARVDKDGGRLAALLTGADIVLDAVFGTGRSRSINTVFRQMLQSLNEDKTTRPALTIISLDLPSGLDADTGKADPVTPRADVTVTLGLPKRSLYTPGGAERAGQIILADIGIPDQLAENLNTELITPAGAQAALPQRSPYGYKGTFGRAMVVAGSTNYIGAAYLACAGAARAGAGLVTLAIARSLQPIIASQLPEVVYLPLPEAEPGLVTPDAAALAASAGQFNAMLIGCGLGQRPPVKEFFERIIDNIPESRLVIDADGLNLLAGIPDRWQKIYFNAILTPHPGEMGRLCGLTIEEVQADRIGLAIIKAVEWGKTIVLKGAFTVVAAPDGRCRISPFVNAGLASAGTGDVLAGVITGLLAQGLSLFDAASLGVYLHGQAGERVKNRLGDTGMLASDLLPEIPLAIKELRGQ
jgi:hydroxyethylthiazole kinase-like uncharacterized protein yjeF